MHERGFTDAAARPAEPVAQSAYFLQRQRSLLSCKLTRSRGARSPVGARNFTLRSSGLRPNVNKSWDAYGAVSCHKFRRIIWRRVAAATLLSRKAHEGHPLAFLRLRRASRPLATGVDAQLGDCLPRGARDGPSSCHGTVLCGRGCDAIAGECSGCDLAPAAPWRPPAPVSSHRGALRVASTLRLWAGLGWLFAFGVVGEARGGCAAPSRSVCAHGGCSQPYPLASRGRASGALLASTVHPWRAPSERVPRSAACPLVLGVPGRPCEGRVLAWGFAPRPRRGSARGPVGEPPHGLVG